MPLVDNDDNSDVPADKSDPIFNYHKAKLVFGLILADINDAIREGDGPRLIKLYKIALLLYEANGCTKYVYTTLLLLVKVQCILPESQAFRLQWNRFCNKNGYKAGNVPLDLELEHNNNILKACLKVLGANINENNAQRIARSLQVVESVLQSVDKDCEKSNKCTNRHAVKDPQETVFEIVHDLIEKDVFVVSPGRQGYTSFPNFSANLIQKLDYHKFYRGVMAKINLWKTMYN